MDGPSTDVESWVCVRFEDKCQHYIRMYLNKVEKSNFRDAFLYMFLLRKELSNTEKEEYPLWHEYVLQKRVCSICLSTPSLELAVLTTCGHLFCKSCLDIWLEENLSCPYCRSHVCNYNIPRITLGNKHKVYKDCCIPAPICNIFWKKKAYLYKLSMARRVMSRFTPLNEQ